MPSKVHNGASDLWMHIQPEASRRMLLAAVDSFALRGYNATTTREIASRAGMSPAAVYVHYKSKAELLTSISRVGHSAVLDEVIEALAKTDDDPSNRLVAYMKTFVSWHARNHTVARVIQYELHEIPVENFDEIRQLRTRTARLLDDLLQSGVDAGQFDLTDLKTTSLALLSLGIDVARWYTRRSPAPDVLGAEYARLALRMVGHFDD